eukprot:UN21179
MSEKERFILNECQMFENNENKTKIAKSLGLFMCKGFFEQVHDDFTGGNSPVVLV